MWVVATTKRRKGGTEQYLEDEEAEVAEHRDRPDENVGKDPSEEVVRVVHRKSAVPV